MVGDCVSSIYEPCQGEYDNSLVIHCPLVGVGWTGSEVRICVALAGGELDVKPVVLEEPMPSHRAVVQVLGFFPVGQIGMVCHDGEWEF